MKKCCNNCNKFDKNSILQCEGFLSQVVIHVDGFVGITIDDPENFYCSLHKFKKAMN